MEERITVERTFTGTFRNDASVSIDLHPRFTTDDPRTLQFTVRCRAIGRTGAEASASLDEAIRMLAELLRGEEA